MEYELAGDQLELSEFSRRKGVRSVNWACTTVLQIGEDGRLGQTDVFADEAECKANQATAATLDHSRHVSVRKHSGEQSAVGSDQAEDGMTVNDSVDTLPDCITLIVNNITFGTPTPESDIKPK